MGVPVDNGVEDGPEVECGPTSVIVSVNTRNNFEGHVFVKGRYDDLDCRSDLVGRPYASIELPFNACGLKRERSV